MVVSKLFERCLVQYCTMKDDKRHYYTYYVTDW